MIDDDKCFAQKMLEPGGYKIFHPDAFSKEMASGAEQPSTRRNNKKGKDEKIRIELKETKVRKKNISRIMNPR